MRIYDRLRFPDRYIRSRMECREGLFGIGGSGAHTTRNNELGAWGALSNIGSFANTSGQNQIPQGQQNLSTAANFWNTLLSGNKGAIAQTLSPEISTIQNQTQQQLDTTQQFGDRSGGTNATLQATSSRSAAAVDNLINTLLPQAATEVANIGTTQEAAGTNLVNTAENAFGTISGQATSLLPTQLQLQQDTQGAIADTLLNANLFGGQSAIGVLGEG